MESNTDVAATDVPAELLDEQVIRHVLWLYGEPQGMEPGSFTVALLTAFVKADHENFAALATAFPVHAHWMRVIRFHPEGHPRLVAALELVKR